MESYSSKYANIMQFEDQTLYNVNIDDFTDKLKELDWRIFEIIVANGISEEKEAKTFCIDELIRHYRRCVSKDTVWRSIKLLINVNFFKVQKIVTGYRKFNILVLTDLGSWVYMTVFKKMAPLQEHDIIGKQHANWHHGYMIKDVKTILEKTGQYHLVSTGRKENAIELSDGKKYIPDVRALTHDKENPFAYFEVECGTHHQLDIDDKCYKITRLVKEIRFVGQNRRIVNGILKKQLEHWIERVGREKLLRAGIKVYLTTLIDLSKGNWTYIYDMTADEPICSFKNGKEVDEYEGYFD